MKGHFVYGILGAPGIISPVLEPPYIIYQNPTCKELSNNIAMREHPRAGSKQMATYQAVVAQTQSSSSSNLCCSVATQTWSAHVACSLLHTIHYASSLNDVWRTPIQPRPQTALLLRLYIFSRTRSSSMLAALLSLPLFFPPLSFFPLKINWRN